MSTIIVMIYQNTDGQALSHRRPIILKGLAWDFPSLWVPWHLKSPTTQLFVQQLAHANYKENIKPMHCWPKIVQAFLYHIFHIFIISCLCSRFQVRNQWFFYSVITFTYIKCFVHSYTVDVVFTLSCHDLTVMLPEFSWAPHRSEWHVPTDVAGPEDKCLSRPISCAVCCSIKIH